MDRSHYSAFESLRDKRPVEIRALAASDRDDLLDTVGRMSAESRYTRFFAPKRSFSTAEIAYYTEIDFINHVALVAVLEDQGPVKIVAGARYVVSEPRQAEIAFAVDDSYQGQGLGTLLMKHLFAIAGAAGLDTLYAEVLPENTRMLKIFERYGTAVHTSHERGVVHVTIRLDSSAR